MIRKNKYPDGSFHPIIDIQKFNPKVVNNITFRVNSYEDLWFLKQIKDVLDFNKIKCSVTIPCLFDSQADKRFESNQSNNLALVCQFINDMNWEDVFIFHPHNQEVVEGIIKNIKIIDNSIFIKKVLKLIPKEQDLTILAPDAGAYKWINKTMDSLKFEGSILSASKYRISNEGKSTTIQNLPNHNFENENVLIIDDIIIGGGTAIKLAEMLTKEKCHQIYCASSHITVSEPNSKLWNVFDRVFTTNSKNLDYNDNSVETLKYPENLTIIDLFE